MRIVKPSPLKSLAAMLSVAAGPNLGLAVQPLRPHESAMAIFSLSPQHSLKFVQRTWLSDINNPALQGMLGGEGHNGDMPAPEIQKGGFSAPPVAAARGPQGEPPVPEPEKEKPVFIPDAFKKVLKDEEYIQLESKEAAPPRTLAELSAPNDILDDGQPLYTTDRLALALQRDKAKLVIVQTDGFGAIDKVFASAYKGLPGLPELVASGIRAVAISQSTLFEDIRKDALAKPGVTPQNVQEHYDHALTGVQNDGLLLSAQQDVRQTLPFSLLVEAGGMRSGLVEHGAHTATFIQEAIPKIAGQAVDKLNWWDQVHNFFGSSDTPLERYTHRLNETLAEQAASGKPGLREQLGTAIDADFTESAKRIVDLAQNDRIILLTTRQYDQPLMDKLTNAFGEGNISKMFLSNSDEYSYEASRFYHLGRANDAIRGIELLPLEEPEEATQLKAVSMPNWNNLMATEETPLGASSVSPSRKNTFKPQP